MAGANCTTITQNNVCQNSEGIYSEDDDAGNAATANMIDLNDVENNYDGILLTGNAQNNTITLNTVSSNADMGIELEWGPSYNAVTANTVASNGNIGICIDEANYNGVFANYATQNTEFGIGLYEYASENNVCGNNVISNGNPNTGEAGGIQIKGAEGNFISGNTITSNCFYGVDFETGAFGNILYANTITLTQHGYYSWDSAGVYLYGAGYNVVSGNVISQNQMDGVMFYGGDSWNYGNTITGNYISNNLDGLALNSIYYIGYGNMIYRNDFIGNTQYQIYGVPATGYTFNDGGNPASGNYYSGVAGDSSPLATMCSPHTVAHYRPTAAQSPLTKQPKQA